MIWSTDEFVDVVNSDQYEISPPFTCNEIEYTQREFNWKEWRLGMSENYKQSAYFKDYIDLVCIMMGKQVNDPHLS